MQKFAIILTLCFVSSLACKRIDTSNLNLVNGKVDDTNAFPAVGLLEAKRGQVKEGLCTASVISSYVVLTAAHCVSTTVSSSPNGLGNEQFGGLSGQPVSALTADITLGDQVYKGGRPLIHPSYVSTKEVLSGPDVAVVIFPKGTFADITPIAVSSGSQKYPKAGLKVMIVGLGKTDQFDENSFDSKKRYGTNTLTQVSDVLRFTGQTQTSTADGSNVFNSQGDSGGPMFAYTGISKGEIIGVSSTQYAVKQGDTSGTGNYTNLLEESVESFLSSYLGEGQKLELPVIAIDGNSSTPTPAPIPKNRQQPPQNPNNGSPSYNGGQFVCPDGRPPLFGNAETGFACAN